MAIGIQYGPPQKTLLQHVSALTSTLHWVAADGRRVHVAKMDDGHLVNTVRKLRRDATTMLQQEELAPHGVAREDYLLARVRPYAAMLRELKKRGLAEKALDLTPPRKRRIDRALADAHAQMFDHMTMGDGDEDDQWRVRR